VKDLDRDVVTGEVVNDEEAVTGKPPKDEAPRSRNKINQGVVDHLVEAGIMNRFDARGLDPAALKRATEPFHVYVPVKWPVDDDD
jgi:hypothetical protein